MTLPFENDNDDNANITKKTSNRQIGLKKTNTVIPKSTDAKIKDNFEQQANEKFNQIEDYKSQMWDLSLKYKSFIESKVLKENRGPIASNLEKEVLEKLVSLATDMNEDESQSQGIGGIALNMLLMKCMLLQRDIINSLNFKLEQLEKKISK